MNPLIKKQFLLEAFEYNQSLDFPFHIYFEEPFQYYQHNTIHFKTIQNVPEKYSKTNMLEKTYVSLINKHIDLETSNIHKKFLINAEKEFIFPYFDHFFKENKDLQLDLLKFYSSLVGYTRPHFEFLKDLDKKEVESLLTQVNHWLPYGTHNLEALNQLMLFKNFNEGFRVSIFKKHVEKNLKTINKKPELSKGLEDFLDKNYLDSFDLIANNVVAIQSRFQAIDSTLYHNSFSKETTVCLYESIQLDKILKSFQISGWKETSYGSVFNLYHDYLKNNNKFKINSTTSQNQKQVEVFIIMPDNTFTLENYKNDMLVIFSHFRQYPNTILTSEIISKTLFNHKLNSHLPAKETKKNANKI